MKAYVLYNTYRVEANEAYVYLYGRQEDGKTFLTRNKYKPYFYIRRKDDKKAKELAADIKTQGSDKHNFEEEKLVKVILNNPRDVPAVRDKFEQAGIPTYEADVRFTYRFMIDKLIQGSCEIKGKESQHAFVDCYYEEPEFKKAEFFPSLKILSMDIETGDRGRLLYCVSLVGSDGFSKVLMVSPTPVEGVETFVTEKECLEAFCAAVRKYDPDIITGWSVIDFDLHTLQQLCDKNHVPFILGRSDDNSRIKLDRHYFRESTADIPGRMVLDGIMLLKISFVRLEDYKLDTAAHTILGEQKLISGKNKLQEIEDAYKNDKKKLAEYCRKDSELVLKILAKKKVLELSIRRSLLTGMQLDRVRASIASLDNLYLRELEKRGYAANTHTYVEKEEQITGGYVMESQAGIYDYVIVCDFKSLYPSVMRSLNIDPLSYIPGKKLAKSTKDFVVAENGAVFKNTNGILPDILEKLHKAREEYRKTKDDTAIYAIKVLMNSFFGSLASPQCRFFSMEVANAITVTCQSVIKRTMELIKAKGYNVIYGDSVTGERPIIIRKDGIIDIIPINKLYSRSASKTSKRMEKEVIDLRSSGIETLTVDPKTGESCFKPINEVIRHKTNKKIYRVHQKYGETRCTEDHSLITKENGKFMETKPKELEGKQLAHIEKIHELRTMQKIDLYPLLSKYASSSSYKGNWKLATVQADDEHIWFGWTTRRNTVKLKRHISFPSTEGDALLRLLGAYVAEGSSSTPETTDTRWGAMIASQDKGFLQQLKHDYETVFTNVQTTIIASNKPGERTLHYQNASGLKTITYTDTTQKLNMMTQLAAVFFRELAGQTSNGKKVPSFVFHLPRREQEIFLNYYVLGDGSRKVSDAYTEEYKQRHFKCTTKSLLLTAGLSFLLKQLSYTLSIQYRPSKKAYTITTSDRSNTNLTTKITEEEHDGYVYDLNVQDTHIFVDGCGQILLHNTDSIFIDLNVQSLEEASAIGNKIQKEINEFFAKWMPEHYHRRSYLDLQFEKTFVRFYMPLTRGGEGSKKRYAGMRIVDGKEKIEFTGLEFVRRDWTELAKEFQLGILDRIFHKQEVTLFIQQFVWDLKEGKLDKLLVYKKALRKELSEYTKTTPQHVKAARKMTEITSNLIEYVITEDGPQPVDNRTSPIDYQHYIDKQLEPIANSVLIFYNTNFSDLIAGSSQKNLFSF